MEITIQYSEGCPNWQLAEERVRSALAQCGRVSTNLTFERVDTPERAEAAGFRGSPTILVNGRDPFAESSPPVGLTCRLFVTPDGVAGSPTTGQLVHAIESAATLSSAGDA